MMLEPPLTSPAPPLEQEQGAFVFFSYAHQDKGLRDRLEEHLCNLKYRGLITTWYDREISAGEEWARQIDIYLNKAHIILLLISASFMASEYCYSIEMRRALERHEHQEADVIPILLRPVLYTDAPFAKLHMLPTNGKPIVQWRERDSAFVDIAYAIEKVAKKYVPSAQTIPRLPTEHEPYVGELAVPSGPQAQSLGPPPVAVPAGQPAAQARGRRLSRLLPTFVGLVALVILSIGILNYYTISSQAAARALATTTAQAYTTATFASGTSIANANITATAVANAHATATAANATATVAPAPTPTSIVVITPTAPPTTAITPTAPAPIIILGLLLLIGVIAALIAIGAIHAKIGQRRAQGAFEAARKRGYYEEAIEAYRRALSRNPRDADALRGMGNALYALGYYDQALDAFTRAIDCDSTPAAYAGQGNVFTRLKRYNEAVAAYEKAIELDPTVSFNHDDLMQALLALGRKEEAERVRAKTRQLSYDD